MAIIAVTRGSAVAVRTQYFRPAQAGGDRGSDLASLPGPSRGTVELPLRLYWSYPTAAGH